MVVTQEDIQMIFNVGDSNGAGVKDALEVLGVKNLVKNNAKSVTENGVTFTVNDDGTIILNGTAIYDWNFYINKSYVLPEGTYILSGCPDGGSDSTYYLYARGDKSYKNYGEETLINGGNTNHVNMRIFFREGQVFNNTVFKPMIRPIGTDNTYEPYAITNKEVTECLDNGRVKFRVVDGELQYSYYTED